MGKKGASSWLTVVKRAFRSPSKDSQNKSSRRSREENDQEQDEEEKVRKLHCNPISHIVFEAAFVISYMLHAISCSWSMNYSCLEPQYALFSGVSFFCV